MRAALLESFGSGSGGVVFQILNHWQTVQRRQSPTPAVAGDARRYRGRPHVPSQRLTYSAKGWAIQCQSRDAVAVSLYLALTEVLQSAILAMRISQRYPDVLRQLAGGSPDQLQTDRVSRPSGGAGEVASNPSPRSEPTRIEDHETCTCPSLVLRVEMRPHPR